MRKAQMQEHRIKIDRPHAAQQAIIQSKAKRKVLLCGRQFGKSWVSRFLALKRMFRGEFVIYITPTHELGKEMMAELLKVIPPQAIESDNKTDREIRLLNGGRIKFYSGENLDRIRGNTNVSLVIVDEAAFIEGLEVHWASAVLPVLFKKDGDSILISTPNGREFFYSEFLKGVNGERGYQSFHYTSYDNPKLNPSVIDEMRSQMTEAQARQEIYAEPGEGTSSAFGSTAVVNSNVIVELSNNPTISMGIDVASFNDFTVITGLDSDGCMTYFDRFQRDWTTTLERIAQLPPEVFKVIDATGVGAVAFETLQRTMTNLHPFVFTAQSKPELMTSLIKDVEQGKLKYNQTTANEMTVFQYKRTSTGHYKYEAKSGYHDDCVMALALANKHRQQALHTANWTLYSA